jgi:hypothetical protein
MLEIEQTDIDYTSSYGTELRVEGVYKDRSCILYDKHAQEITQNHKDLIHHSLEEMKTSVIVQLKR